MKTAFEEQAKLLGLAALISLACACGGGDANPNPALATTRSDLVAECDPTTAIVPCPTDPGTGGGGTTCTPNCPLYAACGSPNGCGGTCTAATSQCIKESYFQNDCATGYGTCYGVSPPPNYYADTDGDGLYDGEEFALMNTFIPHSAMACDTENIGVFYPALGYTIPVRVRQLFLSGGRHVGNFIEIKYGMAFDRDHGICGVSAHPGDSEVYAVLLNMSRQPVDYAGSAHGAMTNPDARWPAAAFAPVDPNRLDYGPRISVFKHAQYNGYAGCPNNPLACTETCSNTTCDGTRSTRGRMQNVGEPNNTGSFSPVIRRASSGGPYNVWTNSNGFGSTDATDYRYSLGDSAHASPGGYFGQDICWNCN
jgi:hypothetical protein